MLLFVLAFQKINVKLIKEMKRWKVPFKITGPSRLIIIAGQMAVSITVSHTYGRGQCRWEEQVSYQEKMAQIWPRIVVMRFYTTTSTFILSSSSVICTLLYGVLSHI